MTNRSLKIAWAGAILASFSLLGLSSAAADAGAIYPVAPKAVESTRFRLQVAGQTVFVQKFKDIHYAHFPLPGSDAAKISIAARRAFEVMELSPSSAAIETSLDADARTFGFEVAEPGSWVVTMDGAERLFLFAESPVVEPAGMISVLDYGADPTGKSLSTEAIQEAVDDAPAGAVLVIPPGHFRSGSLFLRDGITLHLGAGALLQASGNPAHFEPLQNAFIVIENAEDVVLRGRGTIDGSGAYLRHLTDVGGRLLAIRDSRNVIVEGIILRDPRSWNTHIVRSEHVIIRNVKILNDRDVLNTDGINPDSSRHVRVEDSFLYCGDDAVAVKSTNRDGKFEDVYDITIRNNIMLTQKSALKVGTETHASEMKNILFENNQVIESDRGMALYARDGTHMHDVRFVGNRFEKPFQDYQQKLIHFQISERYGRSRISNVLIKDNVVDERWVLPSQLIGLDELHAISNVVFDNLLYAGKHCLSEEDADLRAGPFTQDIVFK